MPIRIAIGALIALTLVACTAARSTPAGTELPSATPTESQTAVPTETSTPTPTPSPTLAAGMVACENPDLGYAVGYPEEWWANEAVEGDGALAGVPACQYFAPSPVEIEPGTDDLGGIAIRFELREGDVPASGEVLSSEEVTIDGRDAVVREVEVPPQAGFVPEGSVAYEYLVDLDDDAWLAATADNIHVDDATYESSRMVLDRMMETISFEAPAT